MEILTNLLLTLCGIGAATLGIGLGIIGGCIPKFQTEPNYPLAERTTEDRRMLWESEQFKCSTSFTSTFTPATTREALGFTVQTAALPRLPAYGGGTPTGTATIRPLRMRELNHWNVSLMLFWSADAV